LGSIHNLGADSFIIAPTSFSRHHIKRVNPMNVIWGLPLKLQPKALSISHICIDLASDQRIWRSQAHLAIGA
jgi:hypothetical protein